MREGGWQAEGGPRGGDPGCREGVAPLLGKGQRPGEARATERRVRAGRSGLAVGVMLRGLEVTKEPASQDEPLGHETGVPGEPPAPPSAGWSPSSLESQLPGDPAPWRLLQEEASPPQHGAHAAPGFRAPGSSRVLLSTATRRGHRGGRGGDVFGSGVSGKPRARSARAPPPAPAPARLPHHEARPAALHPANPETHSGRSPSR